MKTFRWILLSLFSLSFMWAQAQNQDQLVLRTHEVAQGKKWNLEVAFENPVGENYTAFQMDLCLPAGFEWEPTGLQSAFRLLGHSCKAVLQRDGALRVIAFSTNNVAIPGISGNLFQIPFHRVGDAVEGIFEVSAGPVSFVQRDGYESFFEAAVTFDSHLLIPGDVNGDKVVDGEDVWLSMQKFLGNAVEINMEAADMNKDGVIDGEDIFSTIQLYLAPSSGKVHHKK